MTDKPATAQTVRPIPQGFHSLTPSLTVHNAAEAIEFYKRAFGAQELSRAPAPDGKKIWHAEVKIGDSRLMLNDEFPEMGGGKAPRSLGGTTSSLHFYVENTDAVFKRAVDAGATADMPPSDMFWGDRYAKVTDPFGHSWGIATHIEDVSEAEQRRRAQAHSSGSS